jgi:hypothetical protein
MSQFLLNPLGHRFDGRPFWGFSGAEGEEGGDGGGSGDGDAGNGGTETDPVKRLEGIVEKVSAERKEARDELRPWKAALRELGIQSPDALKELLAKGSGKPETVDIDKIRRETEASVRLEASREIALANVKAEAKGKFADPTDAVDYLRKHVDDLLDREGKPDPKAIERELSDLLEAKPHWGVKQTGQMGFDGGPRQTANGKPQGMDSFIRDKSRAKRGQ